MHQPVELEIDVTETVGLGFPTHTAATVFLPEAAELSDPPVVCFAFAGGGYSRRYFSFDMPGSAGGGQAGWHAARGWIFVAADHLGFGDSTCPEDDVLDYDTVALGNRGTVDAVMDRLERGAVLEGYPEVRDAVRLGIGQSMGGCFTIVLQAQHRTFDAIAALGSSGMHTNVPGRPGAPPLVWPWVLRGSPLGAPKILNADALAAAAGSLTAGADSMQQSIEDMAAGGEHPFAWCFHYDDVPRDIVDADMNAGLGGPLPEWRSATTPACGMYMLAPGTVATEAASITAPVLVGVGERDVVVNPWLEPLAFKSSTDVTVFVCPRMGHMHNFAGTREFFWQRIHDWGTGVAHERDWRRTR